MSAHDIIDNCHQKLADNIKRRNLFRNAAFILILVALASICGRPPDRQVIPAVSDTQDLPSWKTISKEIRDYGEIHEFLHGVMEEFGVIALSVAVIRGKDTFLYNLGIVDPRYQKPVNDNTVFRAASLSKPVFAYLVVKLAEEGLIELDKPLYKYLKHPLPEYPDYQDLKGDTFSPLDWFEY